VHAQRWALEKKEGVSRKLNWGERYLNFSKRRGKLLLEEEEKTTTGKRGGVSRYRAKYSTWRSSTSCPLGGKAHHAQPDLMCEIQANNEK